MFGVVWFKLVMVWSEVGSKDDLFVVLWCYDFEWVVVIDFFNDYVVWDGCDDDVGVDEWCGYGESNSE